MESVRPDWLAARPIAHRGLHDASRGVIENSVSAAKAAVEHGFDIECDVQLTADGEAVVFHDFDLERLTQGFGRVDAFTAPALAALPCKGTSDRIPTLDEFLAVIDGRAIVVCEIKSRFDGDFRIAERAARCAAAYTGPMCLKSFDPRAIAHLRANRTRLGIERVPLGMIAQADFNDPADEWAHLSATEKHALANFLNWPDTRPDFLSYGLRDLPHAVPFLCREGLGLPVMTWTVRSPEQAATARKWADQIVFEGFVP